jgi:Family of unknown function (DUF6492)
MHNGNLRSQPLDIVTACRVADLPILRLGARCLVNFVPFQRLHVITTRKNFAKFRRNLPAGVEMIDEDAFLPAMTLADLRQLSLPGFPQGAGWYFQQLAKLAFCFREPDRHHYLIWDADTIPLRPMEFFDNAGRMIFTTATEEHQPYFDTYRKLLREDPRREFSFISQHMIVQKSILREMLGKIESNFPGEDSWAWKIMRNLEGTGTNLFSEYEMLGHYVKNHYPSSATYRGLSWIRDGARQSRGIPSAADLKRLGQKYDYAAFESGQRPLRQVVRQIRRWLRPKKGKS